MDKIKLDKFSNGITYHKNVFMVDGYLDEYSLNKEDELSYADLIDNKGYVDNKGRIWIYKEFEPKKNLPIPWFTVEVKEDGTFDYKFSSRKGKDVDSAFHIDNLGDLSFHKITASIHEDDKLYDEAMLNDLNSSTSVFQPEIKDTDDFLKRLVKEIILRKEVNIAKYLPKVPKKYILSNWKQGLQNDSKMSAINFINWAEIMGIKFHVIVEDAGTDTDPLKELLYYNNFTDSVEAVDDEKLMAMIEKIIKKRKGE